MMMMCNIVSATKANRLFWLGRYVERGYISLHLLRRYYDQMIDNSAAAYEEFYKKLDAHNPYSDMDSFRIGCLYDEQNPCSIVSGLDLANDNAIVLREEISTETLSYIQLSLKHIKSMREMGVTNITQLQAITDYLLAFWGSVDERVFDERIRNFLRMGRLIENIDMHIRFDYPLYRIQEAFESLLICVEKEDSVIDQTILDELEQLLVEQHYNQPEPNYKFKVLKCLNNLVLI